MKFKDIKLKMKVYDKWWPTTYSGRVVKKLKTRIHIETRLGEIIVYDKTHCQFLEKQTRKTNQGK